MTRHRNGRKTGRAGPGRPQSTESAAHPNSRFTTPATNCASLSPEFANPEGVPIDAIVIGSRRQRRVPLVFQARDWQHGTFLGATLASETTAAATGKVGVLRRDPMAMWPFCGYNMGGLLPALARDRQASSTSPPAVFRVNWFRTNEEGKFLWPGFGENLRVLKWVLDRREGKGAAKETVIGAVPTSEALNADGLVPAENLETILKVDPAEWVEAVAAQDDFFRQFGDRLPQ